jgi:hypothetical protein
MLKMWVEEAARDLFVVAAALYDQDKKWSSATSSSISRVASIHRRAAT